MARLSAGRFAGAVLVLMLAQVAAASEYRPTDSGPTARVPLSSPLSTPKVPETGSFLIQEKTPEFRFGSDFVREASHLPILGEGEKGPNSPSFAVVLLIFSIALTIGYICSERFTALISDVCSTLLFIEHGDRR